MKRILVFVGVLLLSIIDAASGQVITNGDFSQNNWNDIFPIGACGTFSDGSVPNWRRSHGTPSFPGNLNNAPNPNAIWMGASEGNGEGIIGGYPFLAGETYVIRLGIQDLFVGGGNIALFATFNSVQNTTLATNVFNNCFGSIPISQTGPFEPVIMPTLHIGDNEFEYTPSFFFNNIWIFPNNTSTTQTTFIELSYLYITRKCHDVLYLPNANVAANPIPTTPFPYYRNIYIGSSYYNNYNTPVTVANQPTTIEATRQITISDKFIASPSSGYFLARINPYQCDILPPDLFVYPASKMANPVDNSGTVSGLDVDSLVAASRKNVLQAAKDENTFTASPNPATSIVTLASSNAIHYPVEISVKDVSGKLMSYTEVTSGSLKVDMQEYPSGVYFIYIRENGSKNVLKVSKF